MKKIKGFRKINSSKVNGKINNLYIHLRFYYLQLHKAYKQPIKFECIKIEEFIYFQING